MKHMKFPALLLLAAFLFTGCAFPSASSAPESRSATVFAMDTVMELTVYGTPSSGSDEALLDEASSLIASLESAFSVTDPESEISAVNRAGKGAVGPDTEALLLAALDLSKRTGGALDCTVYPVVRAWGFTTGTYRVPSREELDLLCSLVDWTAVRISDGTVTLGESQMIDPGAVAKGYAGDKVLRLFRENGITSALVNLGGNVQALGAKPDGSPWRIAVADPRGNGYAGILEAADRAVVTSGGYERYFEENGTVYRHIIDPADGMPVDNGLSSVTVIGERGILCDALSTALFVMGEEKAAQFWKQSDDFEAVLLTDDGRILVTEGIADVYTPCGSWENAPLTVIRHD